MILYKTIKHHGQVSESIQFSVDNDYYDSVIHEQHGRVVFG